MPAPATSCSRQALYVMLLGATLGWYKLDTGWTLDPSIDAWLDPAHGSKELNMLALYFFCTRYRVGTRPLVVIIA